MPPKKKQAQVQPVKKKKDNVDKTFGMKNKNRSTKVQKFIKQVNTQADPQKEELKRKKLEEKKLKEAEEAERRALFTPIDQRVRAGVDPKSVLCAMFKIGNCNKGARCKFSHDPNVGRRVEKKDLYQDVREEREKDTMDQWDEAKLRNVIMSKHGNPKTTTDKVCKFFIEAVENGKYGWFWACPNGGNNCMYRHSLPEGFVLKTKEQKRMEREAFENQPKITLEEFIETEREKLDRSNLTPITVQNFAEWKNSNLMRKNNAKKNDAKRKLSGREVIMKLYVENKKFDEVDFADPNQGSEWDLSEFTKALRSVEQTENSGIKDYGDGSNPTFEINSALPKKVTA